MLRSTLVRTGARVATAGRPAMRASLVGARRNGSGGGAAEPVSNFPPRTPERTAELERLAEEHNGFLFGEVVRGAPAGLARGLSTSPSVLPLPPPTLLPPLTRDAYSHPMGKRLTSEWSCCTFRNSLPDA